MAFSRLRASSFVEPFETSCPAAPATCGLAVDVPESVRYVPPSYVDSTCAPGAASSTSGPVDEKLAGPSSRSVALTARHST